MSSLSNLLIYVDIGILRGLCNQNIAVLSHILLKEIMQNSNIWSWNEHLTCHCTANIKKQYIPFIVPYYIICCCVLIIVASVNYISVAGVWCIMINAWCWPFQWLKQI